MEQPTNPSFQSIAKLGNRKEKKEAGQFAKKYVQKVNTEFHSRNHLQPAAHMVIQR